jgi:molybdenum-dependent DNA-binding transcriptional regulator ModE
MNSKPWRNRVREEDELLQQLETQSSHAAKRRAAALMEGVAELGSVYAVAAEVGKSWNAIDKAIKKHGTAATAPPPTE